jgi:hypothetical protein
MDNVVKAVTPEVAMAETPKEAPKPKYLKKVPKAKTVSLEYGFELDGVEYTEVSIYPFMGSDWIKLRENFEYGDDALIVTMTRLPAAVIECLYGDDYINIINECEDMMPKKLREKMVEMSEEQTPDNGQNT